MKLTIPFSIFNRNFQEMDLIREAMKNRKLATERLNDAFRKMFKNKKHQSFVIEVV